MPDAGAFAASAGRPRREGLPPPLGIWIAVGGLVAILTAVAAAVFAFLLTPMPKENDAAAYEGQLRRLDHQMLAFKKAGQNPLSIVFIGTSRLKNVTMNAGDVARSAKTAGVERPVASTVLAINWGGFERFEPAIQLVEARHPDVVVLMPELFFEDFNRTSRAWIGFHYLQSKLWNQKYQMFGDYEFHDPACSGFLRSAADRISLNDGWMTTNGQLPGPAMARHTVERLAESGIFVVIAEVPVGPQIHRLRTGISRQQFMAESGVAPARVRTIWTRGPYEATAYCDWAHIDPKHADKWQRSLFGALAPDLNRVAHRAS